MAIWQPDPREARCVRNDRRSPHIWRDMGNHPVYCIYCKRIKGKRYA